MTRVEALEGIAPRADDAVVVGDTPFDIQVAVAGGARSLAVATGSYDIEALRAAGADVVLPDLSDLPAVLDCVGDLRTVIDWRGGRRSLRASGAAPSGGLRPAQTGGSGRRRRDFSLRSNEHHLREVPFQNLPE